MPSAQNLTEEQVLLLAAHYISDVNVESLQILAAERRDILTEHLIYRLLLTLYPTDEVARSALIALLTSVQSNFDNVSSLDGHIDTATVSSLTSQSIAQELHGLKLASLDPTSQQYSSKLFSRFIITWAHHVEACDGGLDEVLPIVEQFQEGDVKLRQWNETFLIPLCRLKYDFYPDDALDLDLKHMEALSGVVGVRTLLSEAERHSAEAEITRDLEQVVTPWLHGSLQQPSSGSNEAHLNESKYPWDDINAWIFEVSQRDFRLAAKALLGWNGPPDTQQELQVRTRLSQTGLAVIYGARQMDSETLRLSMDILAQSASLVGIGSPHSLVDSPTFTAFKQEVSDADFLLNNLSRPGNIATTVTDASIGFLVQILKTAEILHSYRFNVLSAEIARQCLASSQERQRQELKRILQHIPQSPNSRLDWTSVRQQILWLRSWSNDLTQTPSLPSFLGRLPPEVVEKELLNTILTRGDYGAAKKLYVDSGEPSLRSSVVEEHAIDAIHVAYDNASNGNRTRGGIRRAAELLDTFRPAFPDSASFAAIDFLLKATHSLSFYHLTLQQGVPFRPVNVRAQKDPVLLIEKVLEQDSRAYTKLDDLLDIGRNLMLAKLLARNATEHESDARHLKLLETEHRITFMAISSALANHDFDTAYSYITSRLATSPASATTSELADDTSWRAAYATGKYRPQSTPKSVRERINGLSKRMDLLSLALTLAPSPDCLSEILGQWRRCEEEMDTLKRDALEEERAFESYNEHGVPGGFELEGREQDVAETKRVLAQRDLTKSGATYEEEAPMGLFDVARGAASAIRKSAFPLHGRPDGSFQIRDGQVGHSDGIADQGSPMLDDGSERLRKRDMVSNMVTSGLVSGMGWVLGAQPVAPNSGDERPFERD